LAIAGLIGRPRRDAYDLDEIAGDVSECAAVGLSFGASEPFSLDTLFGLRVRGGAMSLLGSRSRRAMGANDHMVVSFDFSEFPSFCVDTSSVFEERHVVMSIGLPTSLLGVFIGIGVSVLSKKGLFIERPHCSLMYTTFVYLICHRHTPLRLASPEVEQYGYFTELTV
jgi:hypothetical protein